MTTTYSIPSKQELNAFMQQVPSYMRPNIMPHAIVQEGVLTDQECDDILASMLAEEPYSFPHCGAAETRESQRPIYHRIFGSMIRYTAVINKMWWDFELDSDPVAWLQLYRPGNRYQIHKDSALGQSRKLTTIALLSDPLDYDGGVLRVIPYPDSHEIPKTRGTLVTFPSWLLHEVTEITHGIRYSLNLGFWGPPFK